MSDHVPPVYLTELFKHAMRINISWESLNGDPPDRTAIYRRRGRWWLLQRRVTNWTLFRLLKWAERKEFVQRGPCYECPGYPEPSTDLEYFSGWEDDGR